MASKGVGGYKSCAACWLPKPLNESDAPRGHFRSHAKASSLPKKTSAAAAATWKFRETWSQAATWILVLSSHLQVPRLGE